MVEDDVLKKLETIPLFKGVSLEDRQELLNKMQPESYAPNEILFEKDDPGDSMYVILSGEVQIFTQDASGNEIPIRTLTHMLGEFSMLDHKPRSASAKAAIPLEVLVLHRRDFLEFFQSRPLVGLSMMQDLVERVRYTTSYLQKVMDATQQLAQGKYGALDQEMPVSDTDAEIQELITSFVRMMRSVRQREESLKHGTESQQSQEE